MTDQFTIEVLANNAVLIEDPSNAARQYIADGSEYFELKVDEVEKGALNDLNSSVTEFFQPLVSAIEGAEARLNTALSALGTVDPDSFIVVREEVEGTKGRSRKVRNLSQDTQILRHIEAKRFDRIRWVGDDMIVIKKYVAPAATAEDVDLDAIIAAAAE